MAFPITPILDTFNATALQNLTAPRAGWGSTIFANTGGTSVTYATDAGPTVATRSAANTGGNFWNTTFVDCEVYLTLTTFTAASNVFALAGRITDTSSVPTYYAVELAANSATSIQIISVVAGARTAIGTLNSQTFTAGDSIGLSVVGTQVTSYYKVGAGAWIQNDTVSDSSITGAGNIGFRNRVASATSIDDFGGGDAFVFAPVEFAPRRSSRSR